MKGVYEYILDKNYDMGFYSNFIRYIKSKKLKPTKKKVDMATAELQQL